jgi:hypothetical protein
LFQIQARCLHIVPDTSKMPACYFRCRQDACILFQTQVRCLHVISDAGKMPAPRKL